MRLGRGTDGTQRALRAQLRASGIFRKQANTTRKLHKTDMKLDLLFRKITVATGREVSWRGVTV